jgi:hypothetical protein
MHKVWPWVTVTLAALSLTVALYVQERNTSHAIHDALVDQCRRVAVVKTYLRWEALAEGRDDDVAVAGRLLPLLDCEATVEQGHPVPLSQAVQEQIVSRVGG